MKEFQLRFPSIPWITVDVKPAISLCEVLLEGPAGVAGYRGNAGRQPRAAAGRSGSLSGTGVVNARPIGTGYAGDNPPTGPDRTPRLKYCPGAHWADTSPRRLSERA